MFNVIYLDPPWPYNERNNTQTKFGAGARAYDLMSFDQINRLRLKQLANEQCAVFCWATWPFLPQALNAIQAWGFEYKTLGFIWLKPSKKTLGLLNRVNELSPNQVLNDIILKMFIKGPGFYTKANSEPCLLATTKKVPHPVSDYVGQVVLWPRLKPHSRKPAVIRDKIVELFGDVPRVEIFARETCPGWNSYGNALDGRDIREVLP